MEKVEVEIVLRLLCFWWVQTVTQEAQGKIIRVTRDVKLAGSSQGHIC